MIDHQGKGTCRLLSLAALALLGCGGEGPDAEENIGDVQQAVIGNSSWTTMPALPFPQQANAPAVAAKRLADTNAYTWVVGRDTSGSSSSFVLRRSTKIGSGAWSNWSELPGTTNAGSNPAMTSWNGNDLILGANGNRNLAIAFIDNGGQAKFGLSPWNGDVNTVPFSNLPSGTGNSLHRPALVQLNGMLYYFAVSTSGAVRFRSVTANNNGVTGTWSPAWITIPGQTFNSGVAAAGTASNFITIMGVVGTGCGSTCSAKYIKIRANTGVVEGSWTTVPNGAFFTEGVPLSMTSFLSGSGARVLARRNGSMQAATTLTFSNWDTLGTTGCFGGGPPAESPMLNNGKVIFVTTCGSTTPSVSTMP